MDIISRLRSQAEQVEVAHVHGESTTIQFEANQLKMSRVEETKGTAVRIVKGGKLGFAASSDESAVDRLVANVLESANHGAQIPIAFPPPQPALPVETFDPTVADLPIARMVDLGREIIDRVLQVEPEARINVELERGIDHLALSNQAGTDISFRRSPLSISVDLSRVKGDDVLMMFDVAGTTRWTDDLLAFVERLCEKLELARQSASIRSGRMPVILAPTGALVLGLPLMLGLNGKNVFNGISPMAGQVGQELFDGQISIIDDATLDGQFGSAPYDDEGIAHQRNVLVEHGVLNGFLYDLKTAAQSGVQSTGNGARSLFSPPSPSQTNLILACGTTPVQEMIASVDEGLLVEDVLGLGQGNAISGAFSNSLSLAFKIERGEIVGRVKDVSIAGNVYDLLRDVAAISAESAWVYRHLKLPYIMLPEINVVAKA
jgi:PmbA protein